MNTKKLHTLYRRIFNKELINLLSVDFNTWMLDFDRNRMWTLQSIYLRIKCKFNKRKNHHIILKVCFISLIVTVMKLCKLFFTYLTSNTINSKSSYYVKKLIWTFILEIIMKKIKVKLSCSNLLTHYVSHVFKNCLQPKSNLRIKLV